MKPKTEELLYLLLWAGEIAARPTFRNLTDSFEAWAYRNGFHRQLAALEQQHWIEAKADPSGARLHRLTEAGRLLAHGGRNPVTCWNRHWDGRWRLILFDVPQSRASERVRLRRSLSGRGFGYLQDSVWITPDPLTDERTALGQSEVDVESLLLLEARPCAGESHAEIVAGAWDFEAIDRSYERHAQVLDRLPRPANTRDLGARQLHLWLGDERMAWNEVMRLDPLLPQCLHPVGYPGVNAWKRRLRVMGEVGRRIRAFGAVG